MKILILVLSALRPPWGDMLKTSMETWDKEELPQTQTVYYCGRSGNEDTARVFYSKAFGEELEEISPRTFEAFQYSLGLDWDLMARVNSSCYVHKQNLVSYCETLSRQELVHGLMTTGDKPFIWGGGQYIFSRDVIERFVANKDKWNFSIMEDNGMTEMAASLGITVTPNGKMCSINMLPDGRYLAMNYGFGDNFYFNDFADVKKTYPHFYFRVKQDLQREQDLRIMRELHRYL